jgi:hypothetical protein
VYLDIGKKIAAYARRLFQSCPRPCSSGGNFGGNGIQKPRAAELAQSKALLQPGEIEA